MANFGEAALGILTQVAPTIATMVGGPLAGQGVIALERLFGLEPKGDAQAVQNAIIDATPEQLVQMRQLDNDLKAKLLDAGIQLERIDAEDRNSARNLAIQTKSLVPAVLSFLICGMASATAYIVLAGKVQANDALAAGMTGTVIGYVFSELKQVTTYWFGSSRSSENKNEMINQALQAK